MSESAAKLVGEWTLVSWTGTDSRGAPVSHGGANPSGELIYLESGRMAVQIQYDGRATFGSTDWTAGTDAQRAEAYSTFNAYCGTFSVEEPGIVVHHVELAIHPDHPGIDKRREFTLEGDTLALTTQDVATPNGPASSRLVWHRRA